MCCAGSASSTINDLVECALVKGWACQTVYGDKELRVRFALAYRSGF